MPRRPTKPLPRRHLLETGYTYTPPVDGTSMQDVKEAKIQFERGSALYKVGEYEEAADAFNEAFAFGYAPRKPRLALCRSLLHLDQDSIEAAREQVTRVCKRNDKLPEFWLLLAELYLAQDDGAVAWRCLEAANSCIHQGSIKADYYPIRNVQDEYARLQSLLPPPPPTSTSPWADLPVELIVAIGTFAMEADPKWKDVDPEHKVTGPTYKGKVPKEHVKPDVVFSMTGVCTTWRCAILGAPVLWSRLKLSKKRPVLKLKMFLERSKQSIIFLGLPLFRTLRTSQWEAIADLLGPGLDKVCHFEATYAEKVLQWTTRGCRELQVENEYFKVENYHGRVEGIIQDFLEEASVYRSQL